MTGAWKSPSRCDYNSQDEDVRTGSQKLIDIVNTSMIPSKTQHSEFHNQIVLVFAILIHLL